MLKNPLHFMQSLEQRLNHCHAKRYDHGLKHTHCNRFSYRHALPNRHQHSPSNDQPGGYAVRYALADANPIDVHHWQCHRVLR